MLPRRYGGTETGIGDDTKPSRDLVCESFEEILGIEEIFAEGCAPCVHTIGIYDLLNKDHSDGEWKKIPDRCIASSIAAGRGVLVATPRHRKATRTQCTIRAPARDHESHSGSGSRKRSGVPSGSGILRTMVRSPHNFQVPLRLPECSAGAVRNPKLHWGTHTGCRITHVIPDPMRLAASLAGQRAFAMNAIW